MEATNLRGQEILRVNDLNVRFRMGRAKANAVSNLSFSMSAGETLAIVGESGSGKSVTALSIMRLIEAGGGEVSGSILFHQKDLLRLSQRKMREVRGNDIGMIFQEPMTSLNPVFTVGEQLAEVFRLHKNCSRQEAWKSAVAMLDLVRIPSAERRAKEFPHQLSGGMRQRVMIAMALACQPKLLIADEPTTALDVTIQAQILKLISELQQELGMAVLLITHDLGVVAETCDRVIVMYGGEIVETAEVEDLFKSPQHPYTQGLLKSIPRLGQSSERLYTIEGNVPSIGQFPSGCKFRTRCPKAFDKCVEHPDLFSMGENQHAAACWLARPR